jgi:hypothetical protein
MGITCDRCGRKMNDRWEEEKLGYKKRLLEDGYGGS